jgi:hypothetical protein
MGKTWKMGSSGTVAIINFGWTIEAPHDLAEHISGRTVPLSPYTIPLREGMLLFDTKYFCIFH